MSWRKGQPGSVPAGSTPRAVPCRGEVGVEGARAPGARELGREAPPRARSLALQGRRRRGVSLGVEALRGAALPARVVFPVTALETAIPYFPRFSWGKRQKVAVSRETSKGGITCCRERGPLPEPLTHEGHLCPHPQQVVTSPS